MHAGRGTEKAARRNRLAGKRLSHQVGIEDETGEQRAQREENRRAVRPQRPAGGERARDERRPQTHQHAGDGANPQALARNAGAGFPQRAIGLAVEDHGNYRQHHADQLAAKLKAQHGVRTIL